MMRGPRPRTFAADMASAGPPSTSGRPSSAAWRRPTPSGCGRWRTRTGAQEALGRADAGQRSVEGSRRKKLLTPRTRHATVRHVVERHGLSQRRATRLLDVDRSAVRYRRKSKDDDADRKLLRALAAERRRFGYRRLREMARRKGNVMNLKKVYRLYREEGLMVR